LQVRVGLGPTDDAIAAEPMTPQAVTTFMSDEVHKWGPIAKRVVPGN
jgi:hypothetical protein